MRAARPDAGFSHAADRSHATLSHPRPRREWAWRGGLGTTLHPRMTVADYLLGLVLVGLAGAAIGFGARALRRALLPTWTGAPAVLAGVVIGIAAAVLVGEVLGTVDAYRPLAVVAGCALTGLGLWALARRLGPAAPPERPQVAPVQAGRAVAAVAVAVLAADWSTRIAAALRGGMEGVDTVWYHLPQAARFVQDGSVTGIHFFDGEPLTAYYPATASLFHGFGIMAFGADPLSPLLNVGWLALALLAGWCIGRRWGVGSACVVAVAIVAATPIMSATQPGGGYSDTAGLALFLAAVGLLVHADGRRTAFLLAAVAAGLAVGVKLTLIAPVAALTVGAVVLARRDRLRALSTWVLAAGLAGGYWYARNLVYAGSPFPPAELSLGPLSLPHAPVGTPSFALAEYLTDLDRWQDVFVPGLEEAYGPGWWALLALAAAGLALAVVRGESREVRVLGAVGMACALAFVIQPQALGVEGNPFLFKNNLRYPTPGLALGLVLLPMVPALRLGRRPLWVLAALAAVLASIQLDPSVWPTELRADAFEAPVRGTSALAGLTAGLIVLGAFLCRGLLPRERRRTALVAGVLIVACAGYPLASRYQDRRYESASPLPATYAWAQDIEDARIGIAGFFLQYPLYGRDVSNHVQYVGRRGAGGAYTPARSCRDWAAAVNAGDYDFVVTAPPGFPAAFGRRPEGVEAEWTRRDPAADELSAESAVGQARIAVFRITGSLDPRLCAAAAA